MWTTAHMRTRVTVTVGFGILTVNFHSEQVLLLQFLANRNVTQLGECSLIIQSYSHRIVMEFDASINL